MNIDANFTYPELPNISEDDDNNDDNNNNDDDDDDDDSEDDEDSVDEATLEAAMKQKFNQQFEDAVAEKKLIDWRNVETENDISHFFDNEVGTIVSKN